MAGAEKNLIHTLVELAIAPCSSTFISTKTENTHKIISLHYSRFSGDVMYINLYNHCTTALFGYLIVPGCGITVSIGVYLE